MPIGVLGLLTLLMFGIRNVNLGSGVGIVRQICKSAWVWMSLSVLESRRHISKVLDCFIWLKAKTCFSFACHRPKVDMFSVLVESFGTWNTDVCCLAVFEDLRIRSSLPGTVLHRPRWTSTSGTQLPCSREAGDTSALLRRPVSVSSHHSCVLRICSVTG